MSISHTVDLSKCRAVHAQCTSGSRGSFIPQQSTGFHLFPPPLTDSLVRECRRRRSERRSRGALPYLPTRCYAMPGSGYAMPGTDVAYGAASGEAKIIVGTHG
eukprot:3297046-Rhodomonas_salina.2